MTLVLGISAFYHDSAAALLRNGEIVAAAQEERFTRVKHDARFPTNAIQYCLSEAQTTIDEVPLVVFYDKPLLKFERLLETYIHFAPHGFTSFRKAMPVWIKDKLLQKQHIRSHLRNLSAGRNPQFELCFTEHHQSHAASAFFPSPFTSAAVLCLDGVGEWATTSAWIGDGKSLEKSWEIQFPNSLGLLYSAFTYYCGFKVNSGEYKLMGLAPYGTPKYADLIRDNLIDIKSDGSFTLNMDYFDYATGLRMTNRKFDKLFSNPPRAAEGELVQFHMDIASSIQAVTEEVVCAIARSLRKESGQPNLCLAGGVALNCVANGKLQREGIFDAIWIQPAAGDAGGALGAAYSGWHQYLDKPRMVANNKDAMQGSYLGPICRSDEAASSLSERGAVFDHVGDDELFRMTATHLAQGKVVGWCRGRMEFGPRALGSRSILGDPRSPEMQSMLNLKIKFRESFRPFAPAVLAEDVSKWFDFEGASPYMLLVAPVSPSLRRELPVAYENLTGIEKLKVPRSQIPAVTHLDYSARIQTVHESTNPAFFKLLTEFKAQTGCGVLVNTSFNVRGEPIVNSPMDCYRCFMRTEMDFLVIDNLIFDKRRQPRLLEDSNWQNEFSLD